MATGATLCCRIFTIFHPTLSSLPMNFINHQPETCQQFWQRCGGDGIEPRPVSLMHVHVYRAPPPRGKILILTFPLTGWRSNSSLNEKISILASIHLFRNRCYLKVNYNSTYSIPVNHSHNSLIPFKHSTDCLRNLIRKP